MTPRILARITARGAVDAVGVVSSLFTGLFVYLEGGTFTIAASHAASSVPSRLPGYDIDHPISLRSLG